MTKDEIDKFAFDATDALIGAGLVLKEERSRAAVIVARKYDETFPEPELRHEQAGFGG